MGEWLPIPACQMTTQAQMTRPADCAECQCSVVTSCCLRSASSRQPPLFSACKAFAWQASDRVVVGGGARRPEHVLWRGISLGAANAPFAAGSAPPVSCLTSEPSVFAACSHCSASLVPTRCAHVRNFVAFWRRFCGGRKGSAFAISTGWSGIGSFSKDSSDTVGQRRWAGMRFRRRALYYVR